jgi:hypothetical protein
MNFWCEKREVDGDTARRPPNKNYNYWQIKMLTPAYQRESEVAGLTYNICKVQIILKHQIGSTQGNGYCVLDAYRNPRHDLD